MGLQCPGTSSNLQPFSTFHNLAGSTENLFVRNDVTSDADFSSLVSVNAYATDPVGDLTTATVNGLPGGVQTTSWLQIATVLNPGSCYFQIQALTTHQ